MPGQFTVLPVPDDEIFTIRADESDPGPGHWNLVLSRGRAYYFSASGNDVWITFADAFEPDLTLVVPRGASLVFRPPSQEARVYLHNGGDRGWLTYAAIELILLNGASGALLP